MNWKLVFQTHHILILKHDTHCLTLYSLLPLILWSSRTFYSKTWITEFRWMLYTQTFRKHSTTWTMNNSWIKLRLMVFAVTCCVGLHRIYLIELRKLSLTVLNLTALLFLLGCLRGQFWVLFFSYSSSMI